MPVQSVPSAPSLYDLLTSIHRRLTNIETELSATRALLAKRRLPTGHNATGATLESLVAEVQAKLSWHFQQLRRPIPLTHLIRGFTRKMQAAGVSTEEILAKLPEAHVFASGAGGRMAVPLDAWTNAFPAQRQEWTGLTVKQIEKNRLEAIDYLRKNESKMFAHAQKLFGGEGEQKPMEPSSRPASEASPEGQGAGPSESSLAHPQASPDAFGINQEENS